MLGKDNQVPTAKVIAFANNKGGVGKTCTVATIARIWARSGKRILLIDLDSQANLTTIMGCPIPLEDETSIHNELLLTGCSIPYKACENIDIFRSNLNLSRIDIDMAGMTSREFKLIDSLQLYFMDYDYILIDCPPALGLMTFNALVAADFLVMPSTADELAYAGMGMVAELANKIMQTPRMNPYLKILAVIVTKYKANKLSSRYLNLIRQDVGDVLIETPIRERTSFQRAISMHKDIFDYDPSCETSQDYIDVAKELMKRIHN